MTKYKKDPLGVEPRGSESFRLPPIAYFFGRPGGVSLVKITLFFSM
jgi:hypothetical protein